jgi:hypothetical protein
LSGRSWNWWATLCRCEGENKSANHWYASRVVRTNAESIDCEFGHRPYATYAAMRCYVVNKLGDEVEVPDELA